MRAGQGLTRLDPDDEDAVDAAMLYAMRWRPARLEDIYDLPALVLPLYVAYATGAGKAASTPKAAGTIGGVPVGPALEP